MAKSQEELSAEAERKAAESKGDESGKEEAKKGDQGAEEAAKAEAAKSGDVSRAEYNKLLGDLQNFKRIEEERKVKEKKRADDLLKEQGKWKDLYDTTLAENETLKAKVAKADAAFKGMLETEMKELPEDFDKSLIPEGDQQDKLIWLRKAKAMIIKKVEPKKGDGTPPAAGRPALEGMASIYTHPTSPKR